MSGNVANVEALVRRDRASILGASATVAAAAWWLMATGHGNSHGVGGATVVAASAMWMAMMVAMMLPPVLPWIVLFATAERRRQPGERPWGRTWVFASGYFAVWGIYSIAAGSIQVGLHRTGLLHTHTLQVAPWTGGLLLVAAGAFQLSPLKHACLRHCRSPLTFFLTQWHDGPGGAFRMGATHGAFCLTCCWALMALSFALGVMNLLWMAALTILLCLEKIAPGGHLWGRASGLGFLCWGVVMLVAS